MILILKPNIFSESREYKRLDAYLQSLQGISARFLQIQGAEQLLTEVHLIGNTSALSVDEMRALPGVEQVIRVSEEYRVLGRHKHDVRLSQFEYQGVLFSQDNLNIFAGLCAVDSPKSVE